MPPAITAILMLGPEGHSPAERWVADGRRAALVDAVAVVRQLPGLEQVVVAAPLDEWPSTPPGLPIVVEHDVPSQAFHFGQRLAALLRKYPADVHIYLGAGSVPLLSAESLAQVVSQVAAARQPLAITNNLHSSDWLVLNYPNAIWERPDRFASDNALGWVLKTEAGIEVRGLAASAATRLDLDTPTDLQVLSLHPGAGPALAEFLRARPMSAGNWAAAGRKLFTPAGRVALIGRVASGVWAHLEANSQAWIRVFSEERGMTASGRLAAGQVQSLVGAHLDRIGPAAFFEELGGLVEAVFFDTRVIMARWEPGRLPPAADRYASDLGWAEAIGHARLREFTAAAQAAEIPVVLGGHGVVAGDLYGLVEIAKAGALSP